MTPELRAELKALVDARRRELLVAGAPTWDPVLRLIAQRDGVNHGTVNAYCQGCRCDDCRRAARNAKRRQRRKARAVSP